MHFRRCVLSAPLASSAKIVTRTVHLDGVRGPDLWRRGDAAADRACRQRRRRRRCCAVAQCGCLEQRHRRRWRGGRCAAGPMGRADLSGCHGPAAGNRVADCMACPTAWLCCGGTLAGCRSLALRCLMSSRLRSPGTQRAQPQSTAGIAGVYTFHIRSVYSRHWSLHGHRQYR